MALVLYDRVQQTGTANTTVSFTLSGSVSGYQSFTVVGNGNTTYYGATDGSGNWEVGIGTYATGGTLTRTTILSSSNAGAAVTFSGTVSVFVTYPASQSVNGDSTTIAAPTGALLPVLNGGTGVSTSTGTAGSVVLSTNPTFAGITATGALTFTGTNTSNSTFISAQTSGTLIVGGTSGTGTITLGRSTVSQTTNIQAGATASGSTKTLNIGSGATNAGAITNITIGPTNGTGTIILGQSTETQTTNIQAGATAAGSTKTINIGTGATNGSSTTAINLGTSSAPSTTTINGTTLVSGGNLGVGTTSPSTQINVYSATSSIIKADGDSAVQLNGTRYSTDTGGPVCILRKARGTLAAPTTVATGDGTGNLSYSAYDGTTFRTTSQITGLVETYTGTDDVSGALQFNTRPTGAASTVTERMRIDSAGLVGIGVTPAASKGTLQVGTLGYTDTDIVAAFASSSTGYNQLVLQNTNSGTGASTNLNISNDAGTSTTNFGELGINSSAFTGTGSFSQAGNVYLAAASTDLVIGTYAAKPIRFVVNSGATDAGSINSSGRWAINASGTNTTATALLHLGAGSATANTAPLKFTSGTNLTTAEAGAVEYDGSAFYSSIAASTRGVVPSEQFVVLNTAYTLTSQTAAQQLFNNTASGAVTLPAGTYYFECGYTLSSMSSTSGSFGFALGGGATFTQRWWSWATKQAALTTVANSLTTYNTAASVTLATASVNTVGQAQIKGTINVTASGTIIPQVSLGVAAAAVVGVGSYFRISPISGTSGATNITVGNWS